MHNLSNNLAKANYDNILQTLDDAAYEKLLLLAQNIINCCLSPFGKCIKLFIGNHG